LQPPGQQCLLQALGDRGVRRPLLPRGLGDLPPRGARREGPDLPVRARGGGRPRQALLVLTLRGTAVAPGPLLRGDARAGPPRRQAAALCRRLAAPPAALPLPHRAKRREAARVRLFRRLRENASAPSLLRVPLGRRG